MRLETLAKAKVITIDAQENCHEAAALMQDNGIQHLPVLHKGVPIGMVSDRDLLSYFGWWGNTPKISAGEIADWATSIPVEDIMSTPLVALSPDDPPENAARLMLDNRISAIPLKVEKRLVGIVTETDFLQCYTGDSDWQLQKVDDKMATHVFCMHPDETTRQATRLMREKQIRHVVVVENDVPVGIVSDRDTLAGVSLDPTKSLCAPDEVRNLMSGDIATLASGKTLTDAAKAMVQRKVSALPITDGPKLIGIITETDLLQVFLAQCK